MMGCESCKNTLAKKCVQVETVPGNLRGVDVIPQMKPTYFWISMSFNMLVHSLRHAHKQISMTDNQAFPCTRKQLERHDVRYR